MKRTERGFTLIELMLVVAIVGILAAVAIPAYRDFMIRARITEGLALTMDAKTLVGTDGARGPTDLTIATAAWNSRAGGVGATSKYVISVLLEASSPPTGAITVTFNTTTVGIGAGEDTLILSPYVRSAITTSLAAAQAAPVPSTGVLDWACASQTNANATSVGLVGAATGTLRPRFAPANCR